MLSLVFHTQASENIPQKDKKMCVAKSDSLLTLPLSAAVTFIANSWTLSPAHTGWVCASTKPAIDKTVLLKSGNHTVLWWPAMREQVQEQEVMDPSTEANMTAALHGYSRRFSWRREFSILKISLKEIHTPLFFSVSGNHISFYSRLSYPSVEHN